MQRQTDMSFFAECFSLKMQGEELPSYVENMLKKVLEQ